MNSNMVSESMIPGFKDIDGDDRSIKDDLESFGKPRASWGFGKTQEDPGHDSGNPNAPKLPYSAVKKRLQSESFASPRTDVKASPRGSKFAAQAEKKGTDGKESVGSTKQIGSNRSNKVSFCINQLNASQSSLAPESTRGKGERRLSKLAPKDAKPASVQDPSSATLPKNGKPQAPAKPQVKPQTVTQKKGGVADGKKK